MISKINGVYTPRDLLSRLASSPRDLPEIVAQLIDRYPWNRPISHRLEIQKTVNNLDRDGVAIMQNAVPPDLVTQARHDIDRMVEKIPELQGTVKTIPASTGGTRDYPVHEYQQKLGIYRSRDPLAFSPTFAKFLLLPNLIDVVAGYLGESWLYQSMRATRTEPTESIRGGFDQWHHDARGRKLNVLLILTDVSEDGPATIVLKGSHHLLYSRARRKRNFFRDPEVEILRRQYGWEPLTCSAPAGSLVFFDSQALHLGRRSRHSRDVFQVNCMTKRSHLWPHEIDRNVLSSLDIEDQKSLLRRADLSVI